MSANGNDGDDIDNTKFLYAFTKRVLNSDKSMSMLKEIKLSIMSFKKINETKLTD